MAANIRKTIILGLFFLALNSKLSNMIDTFKWWALPVGEEVQEVRHKM